MQKFVLWLSGWKVDVPRAEGYWTVKRTALYHWMASEILFHSRFGHYKCQRRVEELHPLLSVMFIMGQYEQRNSSKTRPTMQCLLSPVFLNQASCGLAAVVLVELAEGKILANQRHQFKDQGDSSCFQHLSTSGTGSMVSPGHGWQKNHEQNLTLQLPRINGSFFQRAQLLRRCHTKGGTLEQNWRVASVPKV